MKQIKLITLLVALTALLFSCSDNEDKPTIKNITIAAAKTSVEEKSDKIALTVKTDLGDDITSECKFYSNDAPMANNLFNPETPGTYKIKATYQKFTSNEITITVVAKEVPIKSITLSADETATSPNKKITFTVKGDNGKDVTAESKIYINDSEISKNEYTPTKDGTYNVKATYKDLTSNVVTITVKSEMSGIILSASAARVDPDEEITFTVKGDNGKNVTDEAKIFVDGKEISGNTFATDVEKTYTAKATYKDFTSKEITFKVKDPIFSMSLSADQTLVSLNQKVTFKAISNMGDNIIEKTTLHVDGKPIKEHYFTSSVKGKFKIKAVYKKVESNEVEITVDDIVFYQMFPVVEDYTGTWCGWCPRVAYAIEQLEKKTDKAIPIAIHSGDVMETKHAKVLIKYFGVGGFPTAIINRGGRWKAPEPDNLNQIIKLTNENALLGVALTSKVEGDKINVTVKVKTSQDFTGAKLVVFLLESGIKAKQNNNTSYYKKGTIDFTHNHVLREAFTDPKGDDISDAEMKKGNVYTKDLSISIPGNVDNIDETNIVAFVVGADKKVLNARKVKTGESADDFVTK